MFSKVPGSAGGTESCSLRVWSLRLGAEDMVGERMLDGRVP